MDVQEVLAKLQASEELKAAVPVIQALLEREAQANQQVKNLSRTIEVSTVAAKTGANSQVLFDLLPLDVKLNQDGTVQTLDGKTQPLAEYIKADPKLSLYQASIFGTQAPT